MQSLGLSVRSVSSWTPKPGGVHGTVTPSPHWCYLLLQSNVTIRWPDICACCMNSTKIHVELAADESKKHWNPLYVPLCTECEEHQQIPISRTRDHRADNLVVGLWLGALVLVLVAPATYTYALFLIVTVVGWAIRFGTGILEDWKLRAGSHSFMTATTAVDYAYDQEIRVLDSCTIWQAVVTFSISDGVVFGFGNKNYAADFQRLNSATKYVGKLPAIVRF